jgi:hypothetical protein
MEHNIITFAVTQIRSYIETRPEAADTVQGIHNWWIQWPTIEETIIITQAALENLQQSGEMETISIGNKTLWRRARNK